MRTLLLTLLGAFLMIGCREPSVAGLYHIEQSQSTLDQSIASYKINFKVDNTFEMRDGDKVLYQGKWTPANGDVYLNASFKQFGLNYHVHGNKLVAFYGDDEEKRWCWVHD
ncbi:MAG: hypothetical protein JST12_17270 [Armatimonadetes bacterium]|nr:hypothetical protein [Armatimonadota bacterium]